MTMSCVTQTLLDWLKMVRTWIWI